jgi:hypothetical protein
MIINKIDKKIVFCLPFRLRFQLTTSLFALRRDKSTQQVRKVDDTHIIPIFVEVSQDRHLGLKESSPRLLSKYAFRLESWIAFLKPLS